MRPIRVAPRGDPAYSSYGVQNSYQPYAPHHTVDVPPSKNHRHIAAVDERAPLLKSGKKKRTRRAANVDPSEAQSLEEQNRYMRKVYGVLGLMILVAGACAYAFKWSPTAVEFFDSFVGECIEITCAVLAILLHLSIKLSSFVMKRLHKRENRKMFIVGLVFMFIFEIIITGGLVCELSNPQIRTHEWSPRAVILTHTLTGISALILCMQTFQRKVKAIDPINMVVPVCFNLLFALVFSFVGPLPLYTVLVGGLVSAGLSAYLVLDAKRVLDKEGAAFEGSVAAGVLELFLDFTAILSAAASLSVLLLCKFKVCNKAAVDAAKGGDKKDGCCQC